MRGSDSRPRPLADCSLAGADWIYTYLMTFYRDEDRPFGANNLVFPDVAMPHVLVDLQGVQVRKEAGGEDGHGPAAGAPWNFSSSPSQAA